MKVHEHSSTSVINREALQLHTKRNLKLQLVNSTSSEPDRRHFESGSSPPAVVSVISTELGTGSTELGADCHPIEKHGRCQGLDRGMAMCKKSPLMGSLREKEGQHPVLEVYYFHISDMYVSL